MPKVHFFRFVIVFALFVLFSANAVPSAEHSDAGAAWLKRVNFYRATAFLPPVIEEASLSTPVAQHARYMVANGVIAHSQNRRQSWSSADGAAAAAVSNLAGTSSATVPDSWAVDVWMQAPFHAVGILDPALYRVGFGIYREHGRMIQTAAGLDVIRGRRNKPLGISYPIVWPAHNVSVPIGTHISEYPSPLASCAGYKSPAGLPVIVQIGGGVEIPRVTRTSLSDGSRSLEHCVFDESTYRGRNQSEQDLGRSILAARDAIVLIPREPLQPGASYRVHIETNGRPIDWTFRIGS